MYVEAKLPVEGCYTDYDMYKQKFIYHFYLHYTIASKVSITPQLHKVSTFYQV